MIHVNQFTACENYSNQSSAHRAQWMIRKQQWWALVVSTCIDWFVSLSILERKAD